MKREIILLATMLICFGGCSKDTVVYIPAEPDWVMEVTVGGGETEIPAPLEPQEIDAAEEAEPTAADQIRVAGFVTTKKKQTASSGGSGKVIATGKPTEASRPAETKPKETKPAQTKPVETEPSQIKPAATEPAATETPGTQPPVTEPAVTEAPETEPPLYDISGYGVGSLEYQILDRINEYRSEAELEELWLDEWLCAIGSCRAYESSLVWSHTRPDGRSYNTVFSDYGYGAASAKELLVYDYGRGDGTAMVDKWMSADSHRELLLGSYSTLGVGVYRANGFTYVACLVIP